MLTGFVSMFEAKRIYREQCSTLGGVGDGHAMANIIRGLLAGYILSKISYIAIFMAHAIWKN